MASNESVNLSVETESEDDTDNTIEFRHESSFREGMSSKRITWDGIMKSPPQITEDENAKLDEAEIRLNTPNIENNAILSPLVKIETSLYNTKALSKNAKTYELERFQNNVLLVFNQVNVDGYKPRLGTDKDVAALENTFQKYGFQVIVKNDCKLNEVREALNDFSKKDYTDYGCVGVVVLTHGADKGILRAKDRKYSENDIINCFKVHDKPTLVSKPKLLIIQACRGEKLSEAVSVGEPFSKLSKDLDEDLEPYTLPVEADMLVFHSSYAGRPSIRDIDDGSWFIQSLCSKIDQLAATEDIESIFTEVKREVATDREHAEWNRRTDKMEVNKQMPVVTTTLTRKLYLKNFRDEPLNDLTPFQNLSPRRMSRNEEMDYLTPTSPSYHTGENPDDGVAKGLLDVTTTMENDSAPLNDVINQHLSKTIYEHLKAKNCDYFKYMYDNFK